MLIISCGIYKPVDSRKIPVNVDERAAKNIAEGRSFRLGDVTKRGGGNFEFASSNELWRASINLLDFAPFSNVDYSGGIIITDWFADENIKNEYIKITVRFLSNEIRADGLKIIIHKKTCKLQSNCVVQEFSSNKLENTIRADIIKKAAILEAASKNKKKN